MQKLPTITEFKQKAFELKRSGSYKKLNQAQHALAKTYGFKDYNAIKPYLTLGTKENSTQNEYSSNESAKPKEELSTFLTMKELKEQMKEDLEYSDPNDIFPMYSSHKLSSSMKPVVNDEFFDTEDEAIEYTLNTDENYKFVKNYSDDTKVSENYGEEETLTFYTLYEESLSK